MKKLWMALLLVVLLATVCLADNRIEAPNACKLCGMDRSKFAYSRMVITYSDGSSTGTCSLNCVVTDMKAAKGKTVRSFQVADYNNGKLINAKSAAWVIGGSKMGVMTPVAKWAFADKKAAKLFIKENGGKPATFNEALKAAEIEQADKKPHDHMGHGDHKM